jgi:DNA invertase Pin-like site-specific DNA recombinase
MSYIAYYRVSTRKQGDSGLGLDAQRAAVASFVRGGELIAEYTEVESGKNDDRVQLQTAIAHAKRAGAKLVIAKLDRLSRNAAFVLTLKDAGCDFVACDMPEANTLTIGIMAVMAQHEREMISRRTREAAKARKARKLATIAQGLGVGADDEKVLDQYRQECREQAADLIENVLPGARMQSIAAKQAAASDCAAWKQAAEVARLLRGSQPRMSLRKIADRLNDSGFTTREGRPFLPMTVSRLLAE